MTIMESAVDGLRRTLEVDRWHAPAGPDELDLLAGLAPPVLDVGCGPGRIVAAVAAAGLPVLGIDVSPAAVARTAGEGGPVLERSVFDPVPGEGRWATVLLLDGNVGIGGDPDRLLRRVRALLAGSGTAVVEVDAPGTGLRLDTVRLTDPGGAPGPWFPWAWVGADALAPLASQAGFDHRVERRGDRWFGHLTPRRRRRTP